MLHDARPPVDVKQRCNPTALNLLSDHPFCNAVMGGGGGGKKKFPHIFFFLA